MDKIYCVGLKCDNLSVVILRDFLVAYICKLIFSRAQKHFFEHLQYELTHRKFTYHESPFHKIHKYMKLFFYKINSIFLG